MFEIDWKLTNWLKHLNPRHWQCMLKRAIHAAMCAKAAHPPRGEEPDPEIKQEYEKVFPNLRMWSVTAEGSSGYNCVGWTVGETSNACYWPPTGDTKSDFDAFYAQHGWVPSAHCLREYKKRKIALYALNNDPNCCEHVSLETHDCGWHESKMGNGPRIMHMKHELEGGKWGFIVGCYEKADQGANLDLC